MPTDPFVPADPDARPRQQQNLPPGVALPPADRWEPDRPGDLGPGQPEGTLLGVPGPNVGYAYTLAMRASDRLRIGPHEHLDDVTAVVAEIAGKRAASYGRAPVMADVERAIELLGYDGSADDTLVDVRTRLTQDAAHAYARRRYIVDMVPDELLRRADFTAGVAAWRAEALEALRQEPIS